MESLDLTDDELRATYKQARKLQSLAEARGEAQLVSHYDANIRMLAAEAKDRDLAL